MTNEERLPEATLQAEYQRVKVEIEGLSDCRSDFQLDEALDWADRLSHEIDRRAAVKLGLTVAEYRILGLNQ